VLAHFGGQGAGVDHQPFGSTGEGPFFVAEQFAGAAGHSTEERLKAAARHALKIPTDHPAFKEMSTEAPWKYTG
jgi:hypothetical protein